MNKEDYKIIVYSMGTMITNGRLLSLDLTNELLKDGKINDGKEVTNYLKIKLDKYRLEILQYRKEEFNNFINNLFIYIKENFKQEDYYHLSFTIYYKFIAGINNFDEKFNNDGLIKILEDLYYDIINNSKDEFVKSLSGDGFLTYISKLKELN